MTSIIIFIVIAIASYMIQASLKSKFERYSKEAIPGGMTGRDVALKMLHDNGIYDVSVVSTRGLLTDYYDPTKKTVNLSEGVYASCSVLLQLLLPTNAAMLCNMPPNIVSCN